MAVSSRTPAGTWGRVCAGRARTRVVQSGGRVTGWRTCSRDLPGRATRASGTVTTSAAAAGRGGGAGEGQCKHSWDLNERMLQHPPQMPWSSPRSTAAPRSPSCWPACRIAKWRTKLRGRANVACPAHRGHASRGATGGTGWATAGAAGCGDTPDAEAGSAMAATGTTPALVSTRYGSMGMGAGASPPKRSASPAARSWPCRATHARRASSGVLQEADAGRPPPCAEDPSCQNQVLASLR